MCGPRTCPPASSLQTAEPPIGVGNAPVRTPKEFGSAAVDFAPVTDVDHQDHEVVVLDLVEDSIGANANTPPVPPRELLCTGGPGCGMERADGFDEAGPVAGFNLRERFLCRPFDA